MTGTAELQIGLGWNVSQNGFDVTLHATTDEEITYFKLPSRVLDIDARQLRTLISQAHAYATMLSEMLFDVEDLKAKFIEMLVLAEERKTRLHVRLLLDRVAPSEYHTIRWELLLDPRTGDFVALNPNVTFSRFVNPRFTTAPLLPTRGELRALIVAANPSPESLARYAPTGSPLEPIDSMTEAENAKRSLGSISSTVICERGLATLQGIASLLKEAIRQGNAYSILYIIAHGALLEQGPVLYLENTEGEVASIAGLSFVSAVTELDVRPSLIVLASCKSASSGDVAPSLGESATALGPLLVSDGISAVVAMHGAVTVQTVQGFVPSFLDELGKSGSVYEALLEGRKSVRDRPDWWAPTLFTRMRTGRIFRGASEQDQNWGPTRTTILNAIRNARCTPIVGPGLSAAFFPARSGVASGLAARLQVPIAPGSSNDLARISQYLVVAHRDRMYPRSALIDYLRERILEDRGLSIEEIENAAGRAGDTQGGGFLTELALELGRKHRKEQPEDDPYAILASMNFPVYFTTSYTTLLEDALSDAGKSPQVVDFHGGRALGHVPARPEVARPVVVRLFGGFADPDSLVLTEDDYFNYLTTWATSRNQSLRGLQSYLTNRNLLLVGFGLDDWEFRVLFRSILCMEGAAARLNTLAHVAVQVNPESEIIDADAVQQYLEQYYLKEANFSVRWRTPSEFLKEIRT